MPQRVHTVVISLQHSEDITVEHLRKEVMEKVVKVVIPSKYLDDNTIYHIQPSGRFVIGGPQVIVSFWKHFAFNTFSKISSFLCSYWSIAFCLFVLE